MNRYKLECSWYNIYLQSIWQPHSRTVQWNGIQLDKHPTAIYIPMFAVTMYLNLQSPINKLNVIQVHIMRRISNWLYIPARVYHMTFGPTGLDVLCTDSLNNLRYSIALQRRIIEGLAINQGISRFRWLYGTIHFTLCHSYVIVVESPTNLLS